MPYETKPMKMQWIEVEERMTPIILPQIWNHELQDWVVTSEKNPLPTQVTGSNVEEEEITLFNQLAITSTDSVWYGGRYTEIPRYNEYNIRKLVVVNTHDKELRIRFTTNAFSSRGNLIRHGIDADTQEYILPTSNDPVIIDFSDVTVLKGAQPKGVSCYIWNGEAPTEGSLTMSLIMRR